MSIALQPQVDDDDVNDFVFDGHNLYHKSKAGCFVKTFGVRYNE